MTDPGNLKIEAFDYDLPDERIATFPTAERDCSRLLICDRETIREDIFRNVSRHLPGDSLIIFNNTRVVQARLLFEKRTGARIEIFCLEPGDDHADVTTALGRRGSVTWKCLVGNAASWTKELALEKTVFSGSGPIFLKAELLTRKSDHFIIRLSWSPEDLSFAEVLHAAGLIPLPPYIKRQAVNSDADRYQTVYADRAGSVAAPTAGLHFTDFVIEGLQQKNIQKDFVTLHVGAGTFKPVKSETMSGHEMHAEFIEISLSLVQNIYNHYDNNIIAVGTTSLRTLESLYWIGKKIFTGRHLTDDGLEVGQWEPYTMPEEVVSVKESLNALIEYILLSESKTLVTRTSLLIAPGYQFKIVKLLITNFHQPRSTLLLLVSAFIGEKWKSVYSYALQNDFRFLSYGDACLLFRQ